MGASEVGLRLDGKLTVSQVENKIKAAMVQGKSCSSDPYSGDWNTINSYEIKNLVFKNESEADTYCADNCNNGEVIAVKYKALNIKKFETSDQIVALRKQISDAKTKYDQAVREVSEDIKNAKSKTISCDNCESRINRKYMIDSHCMVCGHDLTSKTAKDRLQKYLQNLDNLTNKLYKKSDEYMEKASELKWMVFGWASY